MIDNKALFSIGYGLYVLIARQGDKDNACIINVAQQVTSEPLQLMICVNKQNLTHDMVLSTLKFNLCPLSEEATMKPFQHFGFQSGRDVDKFAECQTELRTDNGLRYLPKFINGVISCVVTKSIDLGTHTMFIARVMEARALTDSPSITYAYYQQHIKPKPEAPKADGGKKKWVCEVCGYVYEGDELPADFICPWCKHPASDFKPMA
ncbi:MAG: Rubrerythrin [bacterium P3]|nr:MAG: Rubrerythrin [bacterium P3]KWW41488.1 MAG: Rubrerythrin [bacterium F083]